jgi:ubiquinone/menaquinone biosynthesis C-methylase UbiE
MGLAAEPALAARLAELYDLDCGEKADDIDFYRAMARRTGSPVLELACGTGRIAIPLAHDGHRVVGLDVSAAQLARAREKADAAGVALELVRGDMRDFTLPEPFALVIVPFTSFLILAPEDRRAALARVREHLARGGLFVLDVFQPDPDRIAGTDGALVLEWTRTDPRTGNTVAKTSASIGDIDGVTFTFIYDDLDARGGAKRYASTARLHYVYRRELELLLAACGLEVEALYGDYDLTPVTSGSPRLIAFARRRERGDATDRRSR